MIGKVEVMIPFIEKVEGKMSSDYRYIEFKVKKDYLLKDS